MSKIITFNEIYDLIKSRIKDDYKGVTNLCPHNIKIDNVEFTFYKDKIVVEIDGNLGRIESFNKKELSDIRSLLQSEYSEYDRYTQNKNEIELSDIIRKTFKL